MRRAFWWAAWMVTGRLLARTKRILEAYVRAGEHARRALIEIDLDEKYPKIQDTMRKKWRKQ